MKPFSLRNTSLMKLSIVTPSFNQGQYLDETIRSVVNQGIPDLEYIIIDGGSSDESLAIIRRHETALAHWESQSDRGQCHAINKGLRRVTGDVWAYMNSDDRYLPGTLATVLKTFEANPSALWVTGHARYIDAAGNPVKTLSPVPFSRLSKTLIRWEDVEYGVAIQVANFMRREVIERYGLFDESLHYSMDFEYGLRLLADGHTPIIIPEVLAEARLHDASKTVSAGLAGAFHAEDIQIVQRFLHRLAPDELKVVQRKLRYAEYMASLGRCRGNSTDRTGDYDLSKLLRMLIGNPQYLRFRPTWGALRRALIH